MKRKIRPWVVILIKSIIGIFFIILSFFLYSKVKEMDVLPNKYLRLMIIILVSINILGMLFLFLKGIVCKIVSGIIYVVLLGLCIVGIKYSNATIKFLNNSFNNRKEYIPYNVVVLNDSGYTNIEDLTNKKVGYLLVDNKDYIDELSKKISVNLEPYDLYTLYLKFINREIDGIVISPHYLDLIEEEYNGFNDLIKTIYDYNIEIVIETNNIKIKKLEPVTIYISGLDNRSYRVESTGLSDVNMLLTINPDTKTVLITSIPRDYYLQLHGTTGLRDKLTHSGFYGIEMGKTSIEDLFDIKIDYTVKVGFISVINIVDFVGGIDVYSDKGFWAAHYKGWYVHEGMNHMNGQQALAYARERYAYDEGDDHRVLNQQQVFEAVFNKIITNKDMLYKYDTLLRELGNLYVTDIPKEYVTLLIKSQINNMNSWKVIKQTVTGEAVYTNCYTIPGWDVYVKEPDMESVKSAKEKIEEVLNKV